jgi:hypothetical protein
VVEQPTEVMCHCLRRIGYRPEYWRASA